MSTVLLIDSGGLAHYTAYLAVGLSKHRDIILCGFSDELYNLTGAAKQVRIKFYNMGKRLPTGTSLVSSALRPWLLFFPLFKAITAKKYDIVHIQGHSYLFFLFVPLLKLQRKPIYWTIHDVDFRSTNSGLRGKLETLQVKLLCQDKMLSKHVNFIIVHGSNLKNKLISKGISKDKIYVMPHFDYGYLLSLNSGKNLHNANGYVLFFGKIKPYKGLDILIKAARIVRNKLGNKFSVVIAGKGSLSYFDTLLSTEDLEYIYIQNRFIPEVEIPRLFKGSKFLVLPYIDASQSGVVSLAYTFSKPVIVSNVGSIPEYVDHGVTGFMFERGEIDQLANYITKLVEDNDLCLEMGKNAHKKILNEMSLDRCCDVINGLYNSYKISA